MKLCLADAIHNFKCVKNTYICLIWNQIFANLDDAFYNFKWLKIIHILQNLGQLFWNCVD